MLNFRKLKQDFSGAIIKDGKSSFDDQKVLSAKILYFDDKTMRIQGRILGQYDNTYECTLEIDRQECEMIDSDCDCPYTYDCQHLAALLFFLEKHIDELIVSYSKETNLNELVENEGVDEEAKEKLLEQIKDAESKELERQRQLYETQVLHEYVMTSELLATSPFFRMKEERKVDRAEFALVFALQEERGNVIKKMVEIQIALRLPFRSKPLYVPNIGEFLDALRYEEQIVMSGKRYCFSLESFDPSQLEIMRMIMEHAQCSSQGSSEKSLRIAQIDPLIFGMILEKIYDNEHKRLSKSGFAGSSDNLPALPGIFELNMESPVRFSMHRANFKFILEYMKPPVSKMLLKPTVIIDQEAVGIAEIEFFECPRPGMFYEGTYYRFADYVTRTHLSHLSAIREMAIPEPLFGSFIENAMPELTRFAEVDNQEAIEQIVTLPFTQKLQASCDLSFLNGELEASLNFHYEGNTIPGAAMRLNYLDISTFITPQGILARNLVEERKILDDLFQDFQFNEEHGCFISKSEKKIVEFMTDIIPRNQERVQFNCPQNLLDQVIYDTTTFELVLSDTDRIDVYEIDLKVNGYLKGVKIDRLWECMASKKAFIELDSSRGKTKKSEVNKLPKILVLDLDIIQEVVKVFDELGIEVLENHKLQRPLWSLANIDASLFEGLPIAFSISEKLLDIRKQMLGEKSLVFMGKPKSIEATLRSYQLEGVNWLERLRMMYLSGILADDMGLGKTLQAICAITQHQMVKKGISLIVCPTSLLYNWKEEFHKFAPALKVVVIEGVPTLRKKMIEKMDQCDVVITSYTLLQKDIEIYENYTFSYVILDEAQHIKNRGTRNAKSVKQIRAEHRLILSGTPIENSLDEMWSLFDFLMPGFLSSFDRFVEKYIRVSGEEQTKNLEYLRKKVAPFIMRRMKADVLDDLPAVAEIVYHCQLSPIQMELYRSYAESARDELVKLVERDGFDRVQIHVLATLTRLKQICCHPAIFAKEKAEIGDSAKYDMLLELLQTLIEGQHKTVIFSQYTRMLQIMRHDFEQMGIRFLYLDGSSKNRLDIVNQFNQDSSISVFLVSLKAGGTGLNLVSADTVIHYDMWWNPAVEAQATDRVHRIGQKRSVSAYKLITLGTIEEKIAEMQNRKKGLVKKIVSCDDEAIAKLTWEDVLELLKT
jgi:SNF2 family DNA or RNA helicase